MRVDGREATCGLGEMRRARPRPPPRDTAEEMCTREGHAHTGGPRTREGHAPALDTGRLWPGGHPGVPLGVCCCPGLVSPQALTQRSQGLGSPNSLQGCGVTARLQAVGDRGGQPRAPPSWEPRLGLASANREPARPPSSPPEPG